MLTLLHICFPFPSIGRKPRNTQRVLGQLNMCSNKERERVNCMVGLLYSHGCVGDLKTIEKEMRD